MTLAREAAFRSLLRIEKESRYSNLEADLTLRKAALSEPDARLYTRFVYGVTERKLTLDHLLGQVLSQPVEKLDAEVRCILRLTAYQLLYTDRIPESAAVNEGVELCKKYRKSAAPLVNAVSRRLAREKDELTFPSEKDEPVAFLSAFYSVSADVCRLFYEQFGMEETRRLLEKMNETPPLTLRVNTLRTTREELFLRLAARGIDAEKTRFSPHGLKVRCAVQDLPELEEGLCFVQDEASQLAVLALDAKPGMTVLDLCACPGGKSFGTAMTMNNEGEVLSFDLHRNKLSLVDSGAKKLGVTVVKTAAADARVFDPALNGIADRLILDLPCSGLGVIAKKPDLRYKREEETSRLPEIQRAILDNACRYLKPGGRAIFSTCTLLERENGAVLDAFLASHPDFEETDLHLPADLAPGAGRLTLFPHIHGTDGFFLSAFERKN